MRLFVFVFSLLISAAAFSQASLIYAIDNGQIKFTSEAPLELIRAESKDLKGLIDFTKETFAFSVQITSFKGFNSSLQREHFNENYMESERFPKATFTGKLIEKPDLSHDGEYKVRAKGKFTVHGVEQERIIPALIRVNGNLLQITARFDVMLADHDIAIPKVVQHKIAERITVELNATGERK